MVPLFRYLLFVLFIGWFRDQVFRIVDLELDDVLLGDPVRTVLELEGRQDLSNIKTLEMYDLSSDCKRQYLAWFALSTIMCYDVNPFENVTERVIF